MKERLQVENLQVIMIDPASVAWLKKNKEILINGEPFDIKKIITKGNKSIIPGLFDVKRKEFSKRMKASSWFTTNVRASCEINKHASIQFAAENIFDKFYRVFASGLSAPGRNFVITLRAKF